LIRSKNEESIEERIKKFKSQQLFEFLPDSNLLTKIKAIEGDIGLENLGINEADLQDIINNVSIIYHSAATIRFYEPLE
jgi:fatty acyl-CoA reductase